jgi:hypothetical protein
LDVERPCGSAAYFEKIGERRSFVLGPVIFNRRVTRQHQLVGQSCIQDYSNPSVSERDNYVKRNSF